ncbi:MULTISPECIES: hypothetical protein [unclassified Streptomyces]|uniref:hypothetical protein n=1 Tax=unclassified Streptomyces TaxID=2593676 RepID=UPI0012FF511F|nr:hypothetical protein [Streptomyces sp. Root264]
MITEVLNLEASKLVCPLDLMDCYFDERINFEQTSAPAIYLTGCNIRKGISACQLHTQHSFDLTGTRLCGNVNTTAARIGGQLVMVGTKIYNASNQALSAYGMSVRQAAVFEDFVAEGDVVFNGSTFGAQLVMNSAKLSKSSSGVALMAHRISVKGDLRLSGRFCSEGETDLTGANISGVLCLTGGTFKRSGAGDQSDRVLSLARVVIGQNAYLDTNFQAHGKVTLLDVKIKGSLRCEGGTFENETDTAIYAAGIKVGRDVELTQGRAEPVNDRRGFIAKGSVIFSGSQIGGTLNLSGGTFQHEEVALDIKGSTVESLIFSDETHISGAVDLRRVRVNGEFQARNNVRARKVRLKGMSYRALSDNSPDVNSILGWLRDASYDPQVYRQLSSVYQAGGLEGEAKRILVAGEKAKFKKRAWPIRFVGSIFRWTVGYGYHPGYVLVWLAAFEVAGGILFSHLRSDMLLAPIYMNATRDMPGSHYPVGAITGASGATDHGYPAYQPWLYTLDLLLPIVDLRQSYIWIPHRAAEWCSMVFIIVGWALATALVVGLGSVVARQRQETQNLFP